MRIIEQSKIDGGGILSYMAYVVIMLTGVFLTSKCYQEMQKNRAI